MSFEEKCQKLQQIVAKMEDPALSLEESIQLYGQAASLIKECSQQLQDAQKRLNEFEIFEEAE